MHTERMKGILVMAVKPVSPVNPVPPVVPEAPARSKSCNGCVSFELHTACRDAYIDAHLWCPTARSDQ